MGRDRGALQGVEDKVKVRVERCYNSVCCMGMLYGDVVWGCCMGMLYGDVVWK
jgi:hypothetical protein